MTVDDIVKSLIVLQVQGCGEYPVILNEASSGLSLEIKEICQNEEKGEVILVTQED